MPYARARRVLSNFLPPSMPGRFGGNMGMGQGFYSPEENWANTPTYDTGDPGQNQPSKPPEGAASAGRTDAQQGSGPPSPANAGVGSSPSLSMPDRGPRPVRGSDNFTFQNPNQGPQRPAATFGFGRETLRNNPYSSGIQQGGVKRPLSQARRFGI